MLKKLYVEFICLMMNIGIRSPWGRCFTHKTWEKYKNSELFTLRAQEFGHLEAAKMFSYSEFKHFKTKVWDDKDFLNSIFPWPYKTLRELEGNDSFYKQVVKLEYP
jgi:hypothetical protein